MNEKTKEHIQCMIENVGLNATRHQDQDKAMSEAAEVMQLIEKLFAIHIVGFSEEREEVCEHYREPTVIRGKVYSQCLKCGDKIEQT